MKYVYETIKKTSYACPTQYEGTLTDGRMFYIRYRWGKLSFSVSEYPTTNITEAVHGRHIYKDRISHDYDGVIAFQGILDKLLEKGIILCGEPSE